MARAAVALLLIAALAGCRHSGGVANAQALILTSFSFQGNQIPSRFTCNGAELSPQLAWSAPPPGTASFALVVTDPDAPGGTFAHWLLYNLPAETRALPEGLPKQRQLAGGALQGVNSFGQMGYSGPCPPSGSPHHYHFTLYALNAKLNLPTDATRAQVKAAMHEHILATGELVGLYQR